MSFDRVDGIFSPECEDPYGVRKIFPNVRLQDAAKLLAGVHPHAIDYIRQCPVLAIAATYGGRLMRTTERARVAQWYGTAVNRSPRLKVVMAYYHLPLPMRAIKGSSLAPKHYPLIAALAKIPPSTLAQIIPAKRQRLWMRALDAWATKMDRRGKQRYHLIEWAAMAFQEITIRELSKVTDLADFAASQPFNPKWTRAQAERAQERWHIDLTKRRGEEEYFKAFGITFDAKIDYAPFPIAEAVNGFDFVALDSGEAIFTEGVVMHHCVSSYSRQVLYGQSRLFSIRQGDRRVATAEYAIQRGRYRLAQIKGPCNAPVATSTLSAANKFVMADWAKDAAA